MIRTVAGEGRTVLFSSHLLDEVERVADRVTILHQGKLVLSDVLDELLASHHMLTVRFEHPQERTPTLAGALDWSGEGTEWTCVCNGKSSDCGAKLLPQERCLLKSVMRT